MAMDVSDKSIKQTKDKHLHSAAHVLANELSNRLGDTKHFGFYLKMATTYDHGFLRRIAGEVLEQKSTKNPGALFAFLIKKSNNERKERGTSF
jgi:hypothetical protein